jgi:diguanylate cyclase (GGDEF)-like protein
MNVSLFFSVIFTLVCAVSLFLGIYILYINPHSAANKIFFMLTLALGLWSFGFSIAISAPDLQTCLFWRQISAIGWGSFFSFMLHFFLKLTGKNKLLKKWWIYCLLYIPSALTIMAFGFFSQINPDQYYLVKTSMGWVNNAVNNGWDIFHSAYYGSFSVLGLFLVWQWGRKTAEHNIRRQSRLILISFAGTIVLGTLTDIIANSILSLGIPQMAPLLMLAPVAVVYYSIRKYGLMKPRYVMENEIIISEQIRSKIFVYLSNAFLAGGVINFISQYIVYENAPLWPVLIFTLVLAAFGMVFQIIQHAKLPNNTKDILNAIVTSLIIPVITLRFIDFAAVTVWVFPVCLLIISLVFSKRYMLIAITISIVMTQILVWIMKPQVTLSIDAVDYIVRFGIFGIVIFFAFYINKIFVLKIRENNEQIDYQKLISNISSDYVTVSQNNLYQTNIRTLKQLGKFFMADRTCIYLFDAKRESFVLANNWHDETIQPCFESLLPVAEYPWLANKINNNSIIFEEDVQRMQKEESEEIIRLSTNKIKTFLALPIVSDGVVLGFLSFDFVNIYNDILSNHLNVLLIVTNILADAIERVKQEKEINKMAYYDHLTNLPNRSLFKDRVNQAVMLSRRTNKTIAVIFLDMDHFKSVNDTMGHEGGDDFLVKISEDLVRIVRKSDTVSRFGGDEFLILVNNMTSENDIYMIVDKIINLFSKPFLINGQELYITASAGIAMYPEDGTDADTLIRNADIAMYRAKEKGRNRYELCSAEIKNEVMTKIKLTNKLYRALENKEFVLHYQPQVSLQSKEIIGVEALIRWNNPEMGMIQPTTFIPLAEHSGLINPIGEWVLRTACAKNKEWQDAGLQKIRMAVNISVNQFRNPDFVGQVKKVLEETGMDPQYLELEITESIAIKESGYIIDVLNNLKKLGLLISIDDFGTEYSSLSRLKLLPIDRIKMDMQFVHGINGTDKDRAITKIIINLAQNLGLKVVAEGVENKQQLDFLNQKMCDEVQGFYYYYPLTDEQIEAVLRGKEMQGMLAAESAVCCAQNI